MKREPKVCWDINILLIWRPAEAGGRGFKFILHRPLLVSWLNCSGCEIQLVDGGGGSWERGHL